MVKAVFDELGKDDAQAPLHRRHRRRRDAHCRCRGTRRSGPRRDDVSASVFYGLGADGTVGANKNSIKIIGQETDLYAQGYFVYDSKKSGRDHGLAPALEPAADPLGLPRRPRRLRRLPPVRVRRQDRRARARRAGRRVPAERAVARRTRSGTSLPREMQEQIIEKQIRFFAIDAYELAKQAGMGGAHQHHHADLLLRDLRRPARATRRSRTSRRRSRRPTASAGRRSCAATARWWTRRSPTCTRFPCRTAVSATRTRPPLVSEQAPDFVQKVTAVMLAGKGDLLPVSAFPVDGTWPMGTAKWEKRNIALEIPVWDPKICIQCNQCALVCPHAAIRAKVYDEGALAGAPATFKSTPYKGTEYKGKLFTIQVAPEDCTGCNLCVNVCPAKDRTNPKHKAINMQPAGAAAGGGARELRLLPRPARARPHRDRAARPQGLAVPRAAVRVLRAPARAAARRRTSSCSPSSSATACSSPTPPAARRSTAATCRRRRTRPTATGGARPGRTRCSRTTPSSASASAWRSTPTSAAARGLRRSSWRREIGDGLADGAARRGSVRARPASPTQRERVEALRSAAGRPRRPPRRGGSRRSPTTW